jgi:glycosyltransferase 2 family protein
MIGALFNTIIPGAVSGDLVKAYYVSLRYPDMRTQAVTTIFLDRIVGLTSLLTLSAVAGGWNFGRITRDARVEVLYWTVVAAAFAVLALPAAAAMMSGRIVKASEGAAKRFPLLKPIVKGVRAMAAFYSSPFTLAVAFSISFLGQFATCFGLYVVGLSIGAQSIPIAQLLFVIPLGLAAMALPIAPAGLGVGQVVFYSLFADLLPGAGPIGASMATIYQVVYVLVSLSGMLFYFAETSMRRAVAIANE